MKGFVTYFVCVIALIVVSMFQFPSPILVNARKLTSKNAVFSVELIRRNTSATTLQGKGRGRYGSVSRHHHIILSSKLNGANDNVQTELVPDGGSYAMKFSLGTPPVEFMAVTDTGSDLVWVLCSACQSCEKQPPKIYDPTQSSSFGKIACTPQNCNNDLLGHGSSMACTDDNVCDYLTGYGGGTATKGEMNEESVTLPSPATSFPNIMFGCGSDLEGPLGPDDDGIVGLGDGPLSLISQLGSLINYKFSYCLTSASSGVNGKLNFGLDVTGSGVVSTPYSKQGTPPTFYYLTLDSISIGDTSVPVAQNIIIDSGTTLTFLPTSVYNGVKAALEASISVSPVDDQQHNLCYNGDGLNPPNVVFDFSGASVVLKPENTFKPSNNGVVCLAMVPTDDTFIFGNVAQINFHVGYDLQAKQVSFAPQDCTMF